MTPECKAWFDRGLAYMYGYDPDSDQALMDAIAEGFGLTPTEETEDERKERIWRALQEAAKS